MIVSLKSAIPKTLFLLLTAFTLNTYAQSNIGVGVRLGDPSGLSLIKYMGDNALELSVGRTHWFNGDRWYDNRFDDWYRDKKFGHQEFQYWGYKSSTPMGVQVHYLYRKSISQIADEKISGLGWYYGYGAQARFHRYKYDYRYKVEGDPRWYYNRGEEVTDIDIGLDGVIGLDYTFEDAPLTIFMDGTLFMEVLDDPFLFWGQVGVGARYNF